MRKGSEAPEEDGGLCGWIPERKGMSRGAGTGAWGLPGGGRGALRL